MKQIFIDTNILIYCALMTKEGHDSEIVSSLARLLGRGNVELLLPEVVELEYERKNVEVYEQIKTSINSLATQIGKIDFPNYIAAEKKQILEYLNELINTRERNKTLVTEALNNLFKHENVKRIALTQDIMLNAYRRAARGLKPFNHKNVFQGFNADCLIVESLKKYYEGKNTDGLLFCSNNVSDFALTDGSDGNITIHPEIQQDIPIKVSYYASLVRLLKNEFQVELREIEINRYKDTMTTYADIFSISPSIQVPVSSGIKSLNYNVYDKMGWLKPFSEILSEVPSTENQKETPRGG